MTDDGTTRAIAWLTEWDSQGIHRTATAGDEAGANWLIREATGLGAAPAIEEADTADPDEEEHALSHADDLTRRQLLRGLGLDGPSAKAVAAKAAADIYAGPSPAG